MSSESTDRRKYERLKKRSILRINQKIALLEDISEKGMLVSVPDVPSFNQVSISIKIFGIEFILDGEIRWRSNQDDFSGLYSIGIEIIDPPEKYRKIIRKNIEKNRTI